MLVTLNHLGYFNSYFFTVWEGRGGREGGREGGGGGGGDRGRGGREKNTAETHPQQDCKLVSQSHYNYDILAPSFIFAWGMQNHSCIVKGAVVECIWASPGPL